MKENVETRFALVWYRQEQYQKVRNYCVDRLKMDDTYSEWLKNALDTEQMMKHYGHEPTRIILDPEEFKEWCEHQDKKPNAEARSEFVSRKLREQNESDGA